MKKTTVEDIYMLAEANAKLNSIKNIISSYRLDADNKLRAIELILKDDEEE